MEMEMKIYDLFQWKLLIYKLIFLINFWFIDN